MSGEFWQVYEGAGGEVNPNLATWLSSARQIPLYFMDLQSYM